MFFYGPRGRHEPPRMIYSQAFRNEQFSPAVALFSAAGLIRTTAGIHDQERSKKPSTTAQFTPRSSTLT
ncbi:hypothetical protein OESDEN_03060 [Oesophagostomum dentatum]|uniref:Uncharacterized protein n=1 Tax=Oesophagostomum dentatum TaxID=61180 RepID=A0A0B1THD4_OESDE|nr:hypothetical protein OESDEN_03060 [Oesophagostomum dentatum]